MNEWLVKVEIVKNGWKIIISKRKTLEFDSEILINNVKL